MNRSPKVFWTGTVVGGAVLAFGIGGLVADAGPGVTDVKLVPWLIWVFGLLLVHDLVVVPLVLLVGRVLGRVSGGRVRAAAQAGLALTALVTLVAYPLLRGVGRATQPGNASVQPLNYWAGLAVVLTVVWIGVVAVSAAATAAGRRR